MLVSAVSYENRLPKIIVLNPKDGYISRNSEDGAFTTEVLLPQ